MGPVSLVGSRAGILRPGADEEKPSPECMRERWADWLMFEEVEEALLVPLSEVVSEKLERGGASSGSSEGAGAIWTPASH